MTSGQITFYVDTEFQICPDTYGVGFDAKSGVFNCGITGRYLGLFCSSTCKPNFAVREIKVWETKIMNVLADKNFYILPGNDGTTPMYNSPMDIYKVFITGSYSSDDWHDTYVISRNSRTKAGMCIGLPKKAIISSITTSITGDHGHEWQIKIRNQTIDWTAD